jgi:hypothetical protein
MAAIDFSTSPTNGQVFTAGDKTWTYSTAVGAFADVEVGWSILEDEAELLLLI